MNSNRYCVIMCGGVGSRFWPFSKAARPKQFIDFFGTGRSLLQMAFDRLQGIVPTENIILLTNESYAPIIKETYAYLEKENDQRQKEMEEDYVGLVKSGHPMAAHDLLQDFSDRTLSHALEVAHDLENRLFTRLTADIQKEYLFHGA